MKRHSGLRGCLGVNTDNSVFNRDYNKVGEFLINEGRFIHTLVIINLLKTIKKNVLLSCKREWIDRILRSMLRSSGVPVYAKPTTRIKFCLIFILASLID